MVDQPWIKDQDSWQNWSYEHIKAMLHGIHTGAIRDYGDSWGKAGVAIADHLDQFFTDLHKAIDGRWSGTAASAAQAVLDSYGPLGGEVRRQVGQVGDLAHHVASSVDQARNHVDAIPQPKQASLADEVLNGFTGGALTQVGVPDAATVATQQYAAKKQAQHVMDTIFKPAYNHADQNMPTFPPIKQPGGQPPVGQPPITNPRYTGSPVGGQSGGGGWPASSGSLPPPTTTTAGWSGPPSGTSAFTGPGGAGVGSTGAAPISSPAPAQTTLSGYLGAPASGFGPTGAGVGLPGAGQFGAGGGGGFGPLGGSAGTGAPVGGAFGAAEAAGAARAAEAAAERQAGAMPMGAAGRGKGEEDEEHSSPGYLESPDDIFGYGTDGPMVAPPVIGE